jgi:5-methylcytosine-specific restriction endonuclease McrA
MSYVPGLLSTFGDVLAEQQNGWTCHYCGIAIHRFPRSQPKPRPQQATVDHMHPLSKGGENSLRNMVLACKECNTRKADMLYIDFLKLLRERKAKRA